MIYFIFNFLTNVSQQLKHYILLLGQNITNFRKSKICAHFTKQGVHIHCPCSTQSILRPISAEITPCRLVQIFRNIRGICYPHLRDKRSHMFFKTYANYHQPTRRHILAACNIYNFRSKDFIARIGINIFPLERFVFCSNVAEHKFRWTISDQMSEIIKFVGLGLLYYFQYRLLTWSKNKNRSIRVPVRFACLVSFWWITIYEHWEESDLGRILKY
jgi:hypothetical protein